MRLMQDALEEKTRNIAREEIERISQVALSQCGGGLEASDIAPIDGSAGKKWHAVVTPLDKCIGCLSLPLLMDNGLRPLLARKTGCEWVLTLNDTLEELRGR